MRYQCIVCKRIWGPKDEDVNSDKEEFSHGLCRDCVKEKLLPKIRKHQLEEGNFDCFGRAIGFCDQEKCKYKSVCLKLYEKVEYETTE